MIGGSKSAKALLQNGKNKKNAPAGADAFFSQKRKKAYLIITFLLPLM